MFTGIVTDIGEIVGFTPTAQGQLHRFLGMAGVYTDSQNTYSAAAMEVILPHVIGGPGWSFAERGTQWPEIVEHGELVVSFGGMAPKNGFANAGGIGRHLQPTWQRRSREAGVRFVTVSPQRLEDHRRPRLRQGPQPGRNQQKLGVPSADPAALR